MNNFGLCRFYICIFVCRLDMKLLGWLVCIFVILIDVVKLFYIEFVLMFIFINNVRLCFFFYNFTYIVLS